MNIGIIIQARLSSTRLPNKILLDFCNGNNILEVLYERLSKNTDYPVIIATTTNENDTVLVDFLQQKNIPYYQGSELDVLSRFIKTAEHFKLTHIIRVCSDNPFLYPDYIEKMVEILLEHVNIDYVSFKIAEKPSILTHYGFFSELVSLNALNIANKTNGSYHHEHVTSYIYNNESEFNIRWIGVNKTLEDNEHIRLTVDDDTDFMIAKRIYKITGELFDPESITKMINSNLEIKRLMAQQITKYIK